ncbi:hypothetical protein LTR85_010135 [Meristemomyces frigidus]|nr:hypothetical protein LTR85_010135 [Meristemomyces frigidus]
MFLRNFEPSQTETPTAVVRSGSKAPFPATMDNSPFARLPPELRNRIFDLALTRSNGCRIELDQMQNYNQLTRTCRQIRAETHAVFYSQNDFLVGSDYDNKWVCKFRELLRLLGAEIVGRIKVLHIWDSCLLVGVLVLETVAKQCPSVEHLGRVTFSPYGIGLENERQVLSVYEELGLIVRQQDSSSSTVSNWAVLPLGTES